MLIPLLLVRRSEGPHFLTCPSGLSRLGADILAVRVEGCVLSPRAVGLFDPILVTLCMTRIVADTLLDAALVRQEVPSVCSAFLPISGDARRYLFLSTSATGDVASVQHHPSTRHFLSLSGSEDCFNALGAATAEPLVHAHFL